VKWIICCASPFRTSKASDALYKRVIEMLELSNRLSVAAMEQLKFRTAAPTNCLP